MISQRIIDLANELRLSSQELELPIDVEKIIHFSGIELLKSDFKDELSGFSFQKNGRRLVGVNNNSAESINRQRFTLAHELGHIFLHSNDTVNYQKSVLLFRDGHSSDGSDPKEREANRFAAELLMPESLLRAELEKVGSIDLLNENSQKKISTLAAKFQVSPQAMSVRLASLSNF